LLEEPVAIFLNRTPGILPLIIFLLKIDPLKLPQGVSFKVRLYPDPVMERLYDEVLPLNL
jgi:hypothetical protein